MATLEGFEAFDFTSDGFTHTVFRRGAGPGVLLMHELPGMVPQCVDLARLIADRGFTVFMPLLFGEAGAEPATGRLAVRACISREFKCFAQRESSPVTRWLRALCRDRIRPACPGPGIGAIGMCFTGGFVLSLFIDDALLAPVVAQPGLPFGFTARAHAALGVSEEDLAKAQASASPILALRFAEDTICRRERFETLRRRFGARLEAVELPGKGHSVLTLDFVNDPNHPTFRARERVLAFLDERLR